MDKQDWYLGQLVDEAAMDLIYTDVEAIVESLVSNANLGQGSTALAHRYGGILSGLVVTRSSDTLVDITAGAAADGDGKQIVVPTSSVSLVRLGSTDEGDSSNALGDGSLTADSISAGEAWLSLYVAFDVALSNKVFDALDAEVWNRQTDSFHFELLIGADAAAPATARANLDSTRVLLCDILLDNNGYIRQISGNDAIANSSKDLNVIGYGLEDTAALFGRRSDWIAIDADGTNFILLQEAYDSSQNHNHAYHNIRAGSAREAIAEFVNLYATAGTASKAGGSEIIGGRPITKTIDTSPGALPSNIDMPTGSIHTQLEALYDFVKKVVWRGGDTMSGALTVSSNVSFGSSNPLTIDTNGNLVVTGTTQLDGVVTCNANLSVVDANFSTGKEVSMAPGLLLDPNLTHIGVLSNRGGSSAEQLRRLASGLLIPSNEFVDNFPEIGIAGGFNSDKWNNAYGSIVPAIVSAGTEAAASDSYNRSGIGLQKLNVDNIAADYNVIDTVNVWLLANKPYAIVQLKLTGVTWAQMGSETTVGFECITPNSDAAVIFDGINNKITLQATDTGGTKTLGSTNLLGTNSFITTPTQYWTVLVGIISDTKIVGSVINAGGASEELTLVGGTGILATTSGSDAEEYRLRINAKNHLTAPTAAATIWVNKVVVSDRPSLV
jgi:hypothetical protein